MTATATADAVPDVLPGDVNSFRDPSHRRTPGRFEVTLAPKHPYYPDDHDHLILVDGWQIGGVYEAADGTWISYGPAAYSFNHRTRRSAVDVQVRAYAIDPSGYDQLCARRYAEEQAEAARRHAEREAEADRRAEQRRRRRLGDDQPGPTVAAVPAYHHMYAPEPEVKAVCAWLDAHGIDRDEVDGRHPIRVEQRADRQVIVYERTRFGGGTETWVVTLTSEPPTIDTPDRPELHALLEKHWPTYFPLIDFGATVGCAVCTTSPTEVNAWPCATLTAAIRGGLPDDANTTLF